MSRCTVPWRCAAALAFSLTLMTAQAADDVPVNDEVGQRDELAPPPMDQDLGPEQPELQRGERPLDQTQAPATEDSAAAERRLFAPELARTRAEDLIDRTVINAGGEEIGRVDEIMVDTRTNGLHAVLATGGFFGIGEREAAVPLQQLQLLEDGRVRLASNITQDQLERMAAFDSQGYEPVAREQTIAQIAGLEPPADDMADADLQAAGDP